jgi:hypothetical protein
VLRVVSVLGLIIAAFMGTLLAEYRSAHVLNEPLIRPADQPPAAAAGGPAKPGGQGGGQAEEWAATILARPLFSPARRPPPSAAAEASGPVELGRLAGVLISQSGKRAIFAPERGKPIVAEEGSRIGPYLLRTIEPGQVTVIGPNGLRVLQPAHDPKARQPGRDTGRETGRPSATPSGTPLPAPADAQRGAPSRAPLERVADPSAGR